MTQCVRPSSALQTRARLRQPWGSSRHPKGGEALSPAALYHPGRKPSFSKALLQIPNAKFTAFPNIVYNSLSMAA